MLILKMSHLKFAARTISSIDNVLYTAWNISTKLVIIEFFDTLREVNIYIRGIWELIWINLLIDIFDILLDFLQMLWDCFINLGASATIFHKSRSVLPGLILNTGAKISDALNRGAKLSDAPSVWDFWERLWNVGYQKNDSKNLQFSDAPVSQTCTFTLGPGSGCVVDRLVQLHSTGPRPQPKSEKWNKKTKTYQMSIITMVCIWFVGST